MTNNSIFTRVLALMICLVMLVGGLTACFQETDHNHNVGTTTNGEVTTKPTTTTTTTTTTGDVVEDEPIEDPVDPNVIFSASTDILSDGLIYGTLASDVVIGGAEMGALVPADVKVESGASSLALSVKKVEDETFGEALSNLDVHIKGVAADNTVPMIVKLGAILESGLGATELKLYHTENGVANLMTRVSDVTNFAIHNQYYYNEETGEVTIYVASFSVFTAVKSTADVWDGTAAEGFAKGTGTEEDPYIIETAAQLAYFRAQVDGGRTFEAEYVKLAKDIDLANIPFDPIGFGYWNEEKVVDEVDNNTVFMGTFDGGNHTIYNLYQNCWELDPDKTNYGTYTYSTAGAGLFASIKNATIKNLAISGAEIVFECVDMGIVVGYAQGECHFENIVITNANVANYNRYTGGLVGEVSYGVDTNGDGYSHTFKNITIDSTVTVSGLWGSFGCGMGGVVGGKWGDATVLMENVVSAPVMDVYNDVVSAYQWYAFRGCGMLIGHTEEPYSDGRHSGIATANFLTCVNVNVYYGDWTEYNYYEFENQDNATGRNYPWVRAEEGNYCDAFSNIRYGVPTHTVEGVTTAVSELSPEELEKVATDHVVITFNQLYGADRGMYGQAEHEGVTVINKNTKTIYIQNNLEWENLKLHYWYKHGDDTWTNIDDNGIDMSGMYLSSYNVYKVELPAYADSFKIVADGENEVQFTLADLEDGKTYTVGGEIHEHSFGDSNKCECGAYKIQKWELVTEDSTLEVGDKIIIVAFDSNVALGTTQNNNNRNQVAIFKNADGTVTINDNVQIITLEKGNIDGTFAFNVVDGYLYAASSSSNYLKTQNNLTNDGSWLITIENGVATIQAQGEYTHNLLKHNSTSSIFSCYESGQKDITIYKLVASDNIIEAHDCKEFAFGATCEDNAICSMCSNVIEDSALGHNYVSKETAPTCTDAGYVTYKCSRCEESYKEEGEEALGHDYVDGICSVCGAIDSTEFDYSGRYYIATIRTSGNYFYMTNSLGTASTKRYQAIDSDLTELPSLINSGEKDKIFALEKNEDGTYSIYAEGVNGNNYLGWTSDNSGILVAKEDALKLTVDKKEDGTYNIHFTASDAERYLALNQNTGSNYFAWYKSGQKQNLTLIPVKPCEHSYNSVVTAPTCTVEGYTTYTCTECGHSYTDNTVAATGHVNTTTTTVAATCTVAGSVTVTCDDCGQTVSTNEVEALGHTTENGVCENCGNTIGGTTPDPEPETPRKEGWVKTDLADIEATDIVVIVWTKDDTTWALSSANGSSSAPAAVVVTVNGNQLTCEIADALKWNISNDNGNLTIYPNGTTATWLYCTSTNNGVRVGTNANKVFTIDATSGYLKNTATSRYVGVYTTTPDVRCYTNTTGNTAEQTLAFYVYNDGTSGGDAEPTEPETLATFTFGEDGSASHSDGSSKTSYSETNDNYTLTLDSMSNVYTGARDAKGNSCIKLGASSKAGSFSFTVPDDVTKVVICVAQYKANTTKITVNGTSYTITTASNNGEYTEIEIDTTVNKTVSFTTVSGGYRAMVNTIEFCG
ncbi:MAG: hypothetical protein IKA84_00190 [Clostridia bacterium]|nr:hypothetical protein [Clostridia bacterium]